MLTATGRPPYGFQGVRQKTWLTRRVSKLGHYLFYVVGPGGLAMPVVERSRKCGSHHSLGL
jgi:hypothetical protein